MTTKPIPSIVIGRLPIYLRSLERMIQDGQHVTSSQELGDRLGVSAAQIRKDLSQFGEFGKQGTGYNVDYLSEQLRLILNLDRVWDMAVIGAGDIGSALAKYQGFHDRGFQVKLIFDNDEEKVGEEIGSMMVQDIAEMPKIIREADIQVAMLAVPAESAQEVTDILVGANVKAILNYAPIQLNAPPDVIIEHIDPAIHLQKMSYYLK